MFVLTVLFYVLFKCERVLYYCHRVATQFQLKNIYIYHIISTLKWEKNIYQLKQLDSSI